MRIRAVLLWVSVALGALALAAEPAQACDDHGAPRAVVHSHTHSHGGITHSHAHIHPPAHAPAQRSHRDGTPSDNAESGQDHHHCCDSGHSHWPTRHGAAIHAPTPKGKAPCGGVAPSMPPAPAPAPCACFRNVRMPEATGPPHLPSLRTVVLLT